MTRERQARLLLAKGYSCEQAIFGAFSDLLGCSTVGAALMAPPRKERGRTCGAYRAGISLISVLSNHRSRGRKKVQQEEEKQSKRAAEAENKS